MAQYILVRFSKSGDLYQKVENGVCTEYVDANGVTVFSFAPSDESVEVVDVAPELQPWMVTE